MLKQDKRNINSTSSPLRRRGQKVCMRVKVSFESIGRTDCQMSISLMPFAFSLASLPEFVPLSHGQIWQKRQEISMSLGQLHSNHNGSKLPARHYPFNPLRFR